MGSRSEGADEVTFLNITGFRDFPLGDLPMLEVMRQASERVFVPMTVGGGIRDFIDANGVRYSALDVAAEYFRSGADKVRTLLQIHLAFHICRYHLFVLCCCCCCCGGRCQ